MHQKQEHSLNIDLKNKSIKDLIALSSNIRETIINSCAKNGGHLASNLGVVELTIALHQSFNFPNDKLLFDVGHQCYTHKILTGRTLDNLRKENGVSGFQSREESNYDSFEAGHSSTSLSTALGMAIKRDSNKDKYEIISVIGDASFANGMALEALNNLADIKSKIIIVLNDNNMSITKTTGGIHNILTNTKTAKKFFESFNLKYIGKVDGHDFKKLNQVFKKAKQINQSVIIHVKTIKGKGFLPAENENSYLWHGIKPFSLETYKSLKQIDENKVCWACLYAKELDNILSTEDVILINPSTTVGSNLHDLFIKHKDKTFDVGIGEEHAITLAAGYGLNQGHAYVSIYSTFLQRAYDQLLHDLIRFDAPVTLLIDRVGLIGEDGETHQGMFDESFLLSFPNIAVAMAKDINQAKELMNFSKTYNHPLAIRYPIGITTNEVKVASPIILGKWEYERISKNKKIAIVSFGPKIIELKEKIKSTTIVNAIFQSHIDEDILNDLLDYDNIILYNPYGIDEGFNYHILVKLIDKKYSGNIYRISLPKEFIKCGTIEEQEKRCHVDIDFVASLIKKINK